MENIQERALKFIYDDYTSDYADLLERSKLPFLHIRRIRSLALETYAIINKEGPNYLHNLVNIKDNHYSFRYNNTVDLPQVRTTRYGLNSFSYTAAKIWNSLPNNIRNASSFGMFRGMINKWGGCDKCSCAACSS
jgi:hypothetical protein